MKNEEVKKRTKASQKRLDNLLKKVAEQVKEQREDKEMTGETIAEESGLSTSYIYMVARGTKVPTIEALYDIVEAMGGKLNINIKW